MTYAKGDSNIPLSCWIKFTQLLKSNTQIELKIQQEPKFKSDVFMETYTLLLKVFLIIK